MRTLTVFAGLIVCVVLTGQAAAQPNGQKSPPPWANEADGRPPRPRNEPARFTIVVVGEWAILLDTTTGETWAVAFQGSNATGVWKALTGGPAEKRDRRPPPDDSFGRRRRPPENDDDDNPPGGKPEGRDTERKPGGSGQ